MKELKNCPLCGGNAKSEINTYLEDENPYAQSEVNTGFYIDCEKCAAETDTYRTYDEAVNAWQKGDIHEYTGA